MWLGLAEDTDWAKRMAFFFDPLRLRSFLRTGNEEGGGSSSASSSSPAAPSTIDPAFKCVLMYLLVGTKGGANRLQMIKLLREEAMNANRVGERLGLDYKTIQHHLRILQQHNVVVSSSPGSYGAMYFLTPYIEKHIAVIEEIWGKFGKR